MQHQWCVQVGKKQQLRKEERGMRLRSSSLIVIKGWHQKFYGHFSVPKRIVSDTFQKNYIRTYIF